MKENLKQYLLVPEPNQFLSEDNFQDLHILNQTILNNVESNEINQVSKSLGNMRYNKYTAVLLLAKGQATANPISIISFIERLRLISLDGVPAVAM